MNVISYSDASDSGLDGYCVNVAGTIVGGSWSEQGELDMEGTQRNETGAYVHWGEVGRENSMT